MAKKEPFNYIVSLPLLGLPNLKNVKALEIVVSTSDRGAVSDALAHKVISEGLDKELKSKTIQHAMNQLDTNYGGAENYAYKIQSSFTENGIKMSQFNPMYRAAQEAFLAEEIAGKKGRKSIKDIQSFFKIAKSYLNFYDSHSPINQ